MEQITSLANLFNVTAAVALTLLIVQFIKPMQLLQKISTRLMTLVIAVILTQVGAFFMGSGVELHIIALFNAFIVATSAMGAYEVTFKKTEIAAKTINTITDSQENTDPGDTTNQPPTA